MKKFLAVLTLISVMLCAVACGAKFPETAKKAGRILEDEDCLVEITDDMDDLEDMFGDLGSDADIEDVLEEVLFAYNDDGELLFMFYCTSSLNATLFKSGFEEGLEEGLEDLGEDVDLDDYQTVKSGKVVVWGHEDLIEALQEG